MKAKAALSLKVLALAALFGFTATAAWADDKAKPDATGTWKWTRKTQDGQEQEISATLKQDGEKLTGKVMSPLGEVEIKEGKVKDGDLSFQITFEREGNEITATFSGKLHGDKIKGKVEVGGTDNKRTLDWEPKRETQDKKKDK
jgi:hypothetical protein